MWAQLIGSIVDKSLGLAGQKQDLYNSYDIRKKNSNLAVWLVIGGGLLAVVVLVLVIIFRKDGK